MLEVVKQCILQHYGLCKTVGTIVRNFEPYHLSRVRVANTVTYERTVMFDFCNLPHLCSQQFSLISLSSRQLEDDIQGTKDNQVDGDDEITGHFECVLHLNISQESG
jgi:hypothetical protein